MFLSSDTPLIIILVENKKGAFQIHPYLWHWSANQGNVKDAPNHGRSPHNVSLIMKFSSFQVGT
jgi:hypothetical protein